MMSKMLPVVALVFVALASADEADFFFFRTHQHSFTVQQNSSCLVCASGVTGQSTSVSDCATGSFTTLTTSTFSGICNGLNFTSTCTASTTGGFATMSDPKSAGLKFNGGGSAQFGFVCPSGVSTGLASSSCVGNCNNSVAIFKKNFPNGTCACTNCTNGGTSRRNLRQATGGLNGQLVISCNCNNLVGSALTSCCTQCFVAGCKAVGQTLTTCGCNGSAMTCPGCSGKGSQKLLLLLLLLLLLIPLLLCCLLLCCCLLRRKKKEQDTHFSTFDPQAGSAIMAAPICAPAPTACVAPLLPTTGAPCGVGMTTFGAPPMASIPML